ncbi:hypothetical protein J2T02_004155 [Chitinophaga terrae (ex Kim and Jung 2007)]|uniref:hypothetical protein n=1 Tax=Chitinophaga terrae (ex Kim and Jung 2007) TaxID=408074 RepID=UPI0027893630|nr:hypothetical protein [Chitinophaga terrae (ex Kim and Jung 2007)]MDQ0109014.1 hypothetical protein [Chitinophaga terrae (ex Kim and Jung 2007)]
MARLIAYKALLLSFMVSFISCAQSPAGPVTYVLMVQGKADNELYVDDVLAGHSFGENEDSVGYLLNPYLLQNGRHTLKLKVYPVAGAANGQAYMRLESSVNDGENKILARHPFRIVENKPEEYTWEINIDQLPYQLTGWSAGVDLRSEDSGALAKEVLAYYTRMHKMYESGGHADELISLAKKAEAEKTVYNYRDAKVQETVDLLSKDGYNKKVKMEPIEDYKMVIYGNGKLVTLERNPVAEIAGYRKTGNFAHWSALIGHFDDGNGLYQVPVLLYRPKAGAALERIR